MHVVGVLGLRPEEGIIIFRNVRNDMLPRPPED